jgi:FkbM family methyltransferase
MTFRPYVAKDRFFGDFRFDFLIENETGQSWYDGSPNQWMPERAWCVSQLRPGMTVVDCGAHHGMLSVIFANAVGSAGRVIAYEALPGNAAVAQQNAKLNHLSNIAVRPVGIGDAPASVPVLFNASNTVVMQGHEAPAGTNSQVIQIVRLDDDLDPAIHVDFIKIDVEGHELSALRGMRRVLAQRPIIDLELHNFIFGAKLSTLRDIFAILDPLQYSWHLLSEIGETPIDIGSRLDVQQLAAFDNPHLFGIPVPL